MPMLRSRQPLKPAEQPGLGRRAREAAALLREKTDYKVCQLRGRLHGGVANRPSGLWIGPRVQITGNVRLGDNARVNRRGRLIAVVGDIQIGRGTYIGERTELNSEVSIRVGDDCQISWDVLILDSDHHTIDGNEKAMPVTIGSNVWIAARASVLKGVTIGSGAVIATGAVVTSDIAPGYLAAGVPARAVRPVTWRV
jgi:acetyltransferase-like isoleucine patch superfamily enzyme